VFLVTRKTLAQRLGRVLEIVTRQSGHLSERPYGSWILGSPSESQRRRRVRLQVLLTVFVVCANLIGIGVVLLLVTVAIPEPDVFAAPVRWISLMVAPLYIAAAIMVGWIWATRRIIRDLRWAIEEKPPTAGDQRNTFLAPWRLTVIPVVLWTIGTILFATLYGRVNTDYIPKFLFGISFSGIVVSASCYFAAEFALRPVAGGDAIDAQHDAGPIRLRRVAFGDRGVLVRVLPDTGRRMADSHCGAGGACGVRARGGRRPRLQVAGFRRHRTG
jgi:adenylate cyclase